MSQFLLDLSNRLARIQVLGADLGAVHNGMASVELEGIVQLCQSLVSGSIAGVLDPAVGLHEDGRTEVLVRVPPVTGAGGGAAGAQDALVHAVQFGPVLSSLEVFGLAFLLFFPGLQPGFNGTVLFVEVAHVRDQILHNVHVWQRINFGGLAGIVVDITQTGQSVGSVNVHGTGSADSLAT